jgi:hypothetical protein
MTDGKSGQRLRIIKEARGFRHNTDMARALEIGNTALANWLDGESIPPDKGYKIAALIPGLKPEWLWTGDRASSTWDAIQALEQSEARLSAKR